MLQSGMVTTPQERPSNIVLIGMPGAGKSTVGILLSRMTCRGFVDTDVLIQTSQGRSLQDIVDTSGHLACEPLRRKPFSDLLSGTASSPPAAAPCTAPQPWPI